MSLVDRCRQRHLGNEGEDEGFTLIELLVVLLIIGILLAIAIPTFLSVTKGANGTAAQSNLTNGLTGAKTYYTDSNQNYIGIMTGTGNTGQATSSLSAIGTGLSFVSVGPATGGHTVGIQTGATGTWVELVAWAPGQNDCWQVFDNTASSNTGTINGFVMSASGGTSGTYYGVARNVTTSANCKTTLSPSQQSLTGFPSP
jgi:type IV pilus assembly protein PilA